MRGGAVLATVKLVPQLVPGKGYRCQSEPCHPPGPFGYAVSFDRHICCAARFETPSTAPISDQLR